MTPDTPDGDPADEGVPAPLADPLYGLGLDEFVAARDAAAREARAGGDRALARRIGALPKPTVAAWAVNRAVRTVPHAVEAVLAIGDELRDATAQRDRERLVTLDRERRRVLDALLDGVADGVRPGGKPLTDTTLRAVRDTFVAAVADPGAADSVRAGRLSRGLEHVGFGLVDETGEPVELPPGPRAADGQTKPARATGPDATGHDATEDAVADAEEALDRAEEALDAARAAHDERRAGLDAATEALGRADVAVAGLEAELVRLREERAARADDAAEAREAAEDSARDVARREEEVAAAQDVAAGARRLRRAARRGS